MHAHTVRYSHSIGSEAKFLKDLHKAEKYMDIF